MSINYYLNYHDRVCSGLSKDDLLHISFSSFLMNVQIHIWRAFKFG
jgi:hypothetical protein